MARRMPLMNRLEKHLEEYLALRKALGFKLRTIDSSLKDFVNYAATKNSAIITTKLALSWAVKPAGANPKWWAYRLRLVHHFARHVRGVDHQDEVPPLGLLPYLHRRVPPHIYSEEEMLRILNAAKELPSRNGLRGLTYSTLFGLLWGTGLRISEALALNRDSVELTNQLLTVHNGKFGKSRLVPVAPSVATALEYYACNRDRIIVKPRSDSFFLTIIGTRPTSAVAQLTFRQICCEIGLRNPLEKKGPRIHDIRHTFAVRELIHLHTGEYRDIDRGLHALSVYMGHLRPSSTYWYFSAVPELMGLALVRLDATGRSL